MSDKQQLLCSVPCQRCVLGARHSRLVLLQAEQEFSVVSRVRKRKVEEHDEGEHEGFDATQLKEHEEFTKVRWRLAPRDSITAACNAGALHICMSAFAGQECGADRAGSL